jgi:hypothetical protein
MDVKSMMRIRFIYFNPLHDTRKFKRLAYELLLNERGVVVTSRTEGNMGGVPHFPPDAEQLSMDHCYAVRDYIPTSVMMKWMLQGRVVHE